MVFKKNIKIKKNLSMDIAKTQSVREDETVRMNPLEGVIDREFCPNLLQDQYNLGYLRSSTFCLPIGEISRFRTILSDVSFISRVYNKAYLIFDNVLIKLVFC